MVDGVIDGGCIYTARKDVNFGTSLTTNRVSLSHAAPQPLLYVLH